MEVKASQVRFVVVRAGISVPGIVFEIVYEESPFKPFQSKKLLISAASIYEKFRGMYALSPPRCRICTPKWFCKDSRKSHVIIVNGVFMDSNNNIRSFSQSYSLCRLARSLKCELPSTHCVRIQNLTQYTKFDQFNLP